MKVFRTIFMLPLILAAALFLYCCNRNNNESGHWQQDEIKYYINRNANDKSVRAVDYAFDSWQTETHFSFIYSGRNAAGLKKDGKNTVSFISNWPDDLPLGHTAWCKCWYDRNGNIIESDIILNQELAKFTCLESSRKDAYYIEGVLVHEIGHMIGLDHSQFETSVMKPESPPEESWFKGFIDPETLSRYRELYRLE